MSDDQEIKIRWAAIEARAQIFNDASYELEYLARGRREGIYLITTMAHRTAMKKKWADRGMGDTVARLAQPLARLVRTVTGGVVDVTNCGGCKDRQAGLNAAFPATYATKPL